MYDQQMFSLKIFSYLLYFVKKRKKTNLLINIADKIKDCHADLVNINISHVLTLFSKSVA